MTWRPAQPMTWSGEESVHGAFIAEQVVECDEPGIESAGLDVDAGNATGALGCMGGLGFRVKKTSVSWTIEGL
jgi:hypothetical protein